MRTVTRIRPLIVEMPTWSVEVARAVLSARMRRPMRDAYRPCRFVRKSARPVRRASGAPRKGREQAAQEVDRKSTRLNSSHGYISYAVFCLKKKNICINKEETVVESTY